MAPVKKHMPSPSVPSLSSVPLATSGHPGARRYLDDQGRLRGAALVIVLSFIIIITGMVVAFLTSVTNDASTTSATAATATVRGLSDTAIQLCIGQLRESSSQASQGYAWASQPGAIRTFNATAPNTTITYKLYSSSKMVDSDGSSFGVGGDQPADGSWTTESGVWTDLNSPVVSSVPVVGGNPVVTSNYPILNPSAFFLDGCSNNSAAAPWLGGVSNTAAMPVRWLYLLRDGTLIAPQAAGTNKVNFTPVTPTKINPIVGRIAFWADDETCKININTAGGAGTDSSGRSMETNVFWDAPRFNTPDEQRRGRIMPISQEYQRYPGHPATVSLGRVFTNLTSTNLLALTPRYVYGPSKDGTQILVGKTNPAKADRLYNSVDELLFTTNRGVQNTGITPQSLDNARFLLTAHSQAPEINLFGKPRVSIWPVNYTNNTSCRTYLDTLLAFDATLGPQGSTNTYYFTRRNPTNSGADPATSLSADINIPRNQALLTYLGNLTSSNIPGYGASFASTAKYYSTNSTIGTNSDRGNILVQIFDYIRNTNVKDPILSASSSTSNNVFDSTGAPYSSVHTAWNARGLGRDPVLSEVSLWFVALGQGPMTVAPSAPGGSITNPIAMHPNQANPAITKFVPMNNQIPKFWSTNIAGNSSMPTNNIVAVQAYFLINLFVPGQKFPSVANRKVAYLVTGLDALQFSDGATTDPYRMNFTASNFSLFTPPNGTTWGNQLGGARPFMESFGVSGAGGPSTGFSIVGRNLSENSTFTAGGNGYSFYSQVLTMTNGTGADKFTLSSSVTPPLVHVTLFNAGVGGAINPQDPIATYQIDLTPLLGKYPVPSLGSNALSGWSNAVGLNYGSFSPSARMAAGDRFQIAVNYSPTETWLQAVSSNDLLLSMVPGGTNSSAQGDYRLLMRTNITTNYFTPHSDVANVIAGNKRLAYSAQGYLGNSPVGATNGGKLVLGAAYTTTPGIYSTNSQPCAPDGLLAAYANGRAGGTTPGDWDNGLANSPDGPYLNLPDEGNTNGLPSGAPYYDSVITSDVMVGGGSFSPNRLLPSAGMFGSIPTGVISQRPWQTLLFRPEPPYGSVTQRHLGAVNPPDYLLLDLFWMPVVDPYAISTPLSTAGKVNLNSGILPFSNIIRNTALRAAMAPELVAKMPASAAKTYKSSVGYNQTARLPIDLDQTMIQFQTKFSTNGFFKSASEICSLYLVPSNSPSISLVNFTNTTSADGWYNPRGNFALVGDNVRERPYANLYAKLTTKSDTFQIHYRVQTLRQASANRSDWTTWNEKTDKVMADQRGSAIIERYIDTSDPKLPDFTSQANASKVLDSYYQYRVISTKQFAP
jgi:uncharacterized protein (TIGR02600 family)